MSFERDDVSFPKQYKPLPPGYRIVQLDSGYFMWTWGCPEAIAQNDYEIGGPISWDRFWVRRCAFAHYEQTKKHESAELFDNIERLDEKGTVQL